MKCNNCHTDNLDGNMSCYSCSATLPLSSAAGSSPVDEIVSRQNGSSVEEKYYDLLLCVGKKYPGETRHETAKRYLLAAESDCMSGPQKEINN